MSATTRERERTSEDLASLYAAHRLPLVRLAVLLVDDLAVADAMVQAAFVRELARVGGSRRSPRDPGARLATFRAQVVSSCRREHRTRPRLPGGGASNHAYGIPSDVRALAWTRRQVVVLRSWAGLSDRQVAGLLGMRDAAVASTLASGLEALRRPGDDDETAAARVADALQTAAGRVGAADLRTGFGDVVAEVARRRATRRRRLLGALGAVLGVALVAALIHAGLTVANRPPTAPPTPPPTRTDVVPTTSLSSPALAPGERQRSAIPFAQVGAGWVVVAAAAPAGAVTTTMLLVAPDGTRYGVGTSPDGMLLQDISPDGRGVLLAIGSEAFEWDLEAGTSRPLGTAYGWKTLHYAGGADAGYLVLWTDNTSQVRLERRTPEGRLRAEYAVTLSPTAGSPGTPSLVVSADRRTAYLAGRDGGVLAVDLETDGFVNVPLPSGTTKCEPRDRATQGNGVLIVCGEGPSPLLVTAGAATATPLPVPSDGAARVVGAWRGDRGVVLQRGSRCGADLAMVDADGRVTPLALSGWAAGLVPIGTDGERLFLGGSRCGSDGVRLVASDLRSGTATVLAGPEIGGRTLRQALVVQPPG